MNTGNRNYDYSSKPTSDRIEYPLICAMVKQGSSVIDLGCGNGTLLKMLASEKKCTALGIELSPSGVQAAQDKGIAVTQGSIDRPLTEFKTKQFDFAICNVTLQMVMFPELLLEEMGRIARWQIVTIPNFAHFLNRLDLLIHGRMPQPCLFGYEWYSTGHIHQLSLKDLEEFCDKHGFRILERVVADPPKSRWKQLLVNRFPNFFAITGLYLLEKIG